MYRKATGSPLLSTSSLQGAASTNVMEVWHLKLHLYTFFKATIGALYITMCNYLSPTFGFSLLPLEATFTQHHYDQHYHYHH